MATPRSPSTARILPAFGLESTPIMVALVPLDALAPHGWSLEQLQRPVYARRTKKAKSPAVDDSRDFATSDPDRDCCDFVSIVSRPAPLRRRPWNIEMRDADQRE